MFRRNPYTCDGYSPLCAQIILDLALCYDKEHRCSHLKLVSLAVMMAFGRAGSTLTGISTGVHIESETCVHNEGLFGPSGDIESRSVGMGGPEMGQGRYYKFQSYLNSWWEMKIPAILRIICN